MTTEATTSTPEVPKKSNKKILAVVSLVLVLIFGTNHFTFQIGYDTFGVSANDSTIVIAHSSDTSMTVIRSEADTTKKDTVK